MKRLITLGFFVLFVVTLSISALTEELEDRVIATVNDDVITMSDLYNEGGDDVKGDLNRILENGMTVKEAREIVLEQIIRKSLLDQAVIEYGFNVTKEDVKKAIEEQMMINGLTKKELIELLAKEGMTFEDYEDEVEYRIKQERIISKKLGSHMIVSDEDMNSYFNEHKSEYADLREFRISEIVIAIPPGASESMIIETKELTDSVREKLIRGADFGELAREYSASPTAENGGDLGYIHPKDLDPGFIAYLKSLKVGEISDVIPSGMSFAVFKLTDKRPIEGGITVDDVKHEIEAILINEKTIQFFDKWLNELREDAFIQVYL